MDAMKRNIAPLERKLAVAKKSKRGRADGQGSSDGGTDNKMRCSHCGLTHYPVCWKKERDKTPEWWK